MKDIEQAKELLTSQNLTCVLKKGNEILTSTERGVAPMLKFISEGVDLKGFCVADKIVGKAAAFLFAKAGITEIFAQVLSKKALPVLEKFGIAYSFDTLADVIKNRTNTDICPMEKAVQDIFDIENAYTAILNQREKLLAK